MLAGSAAGSLPLACPAVARSRQPESRELQVDRCRLDAATFGEDYQFFVAHAPHPTNAGELRQRDLPVVDSVYTAD